MSNEQKLLDYLKWVTADLKETRQRLAELEAAEQEPIAIVGMACRFPGGVSSPDELWQLVANGVDAIAEFPTDRGWDIEELYDPEPGKPGKCYTREGGFLQGAALFDPGFFGISPREALAMDPQQRVLLEAAWEAFEHACIDVTTLKGSRTGVFVGVVEESYLGLNAPEELEGYLMTSKLGSVASGRISYTFGFEGPAVTLDTACSSSLVALHLAIQSLRSGESDLALAGGSTVSADPGGLIDFSRQRGLAPDGRCKSFAAAADGTSWSEGVGLLLVERLSDAHRNGHQILAVVRGSAVNQDGASNGLTAPNGPSQERVIRQALANAGLSPADIDTVEAHGTGTRLGDPIEAQALIATYGQDRPHDRPLWLGSLKSNIGHSVAAAGAGGVIKMVQAMRHGMLPKTLHVDEPSPFVDWTAGQVELLVEPQGWPETGAPRRAAVSSFGVSGTNAHVILEQAPAEERPETRHGGPVAWLLSGKTPQAVRDQAARLATHVRAHPQMAITDVAYTLAACRTAHEQRSAVIGQTTEELLAGLDTLAQDALPIIQAPPPGPVTFLFTGQGSQHPGMGQHLYATHPVFAQALDRVLAELDPALESILFADPDSPQAELLNQTRYTQPALFAYQTALFQLLRSFGITPDYLIGHSLGEISAAHAAGILTLTDAARLVTTRAQLMASAPPGAMISIHASQSEVAPTLAGYSDVAIAATNTPTMTVISGNTETVTTIAEHWQAQGRRTRPLPGNHAFHSPNMDPILDDFRKMAATLTYNPATIPLISTLTGQQMDTVDADYWTNQIRQPVHFHQALQAAPTATYMEIGPDTTLTALTRATLPDATTIPVNDQTPTSFMEALATAHTHNIPITWPTGQPTNLPTYPFQHKRYWLADSINPANPSRLGLTETNHPLLGTAITVAGSDEVIFTSRVSPHTHPWLTDHEISGTLTVPAAALAELVIRAADEVGCTTVDDLTIHVPLPLPARGAIQLQVKVGPHADGNRRTVLISARPDDVDAPWAEHARATVSFAGPDAQFDLVEWPPRGAQPIPTEDAYQRLAEAGLAYGPAFRGLSAMWQRGDTLFAEIVLPETARSNVARFGLHPALLDAALHAALLADTQTVPRSAFDWSGVQLHATGATMLRAELRREGDTLSVRLADQLGRPVAVAREVRLRPVTGLRQALQRDHDAMFHLGWTPIILAEPAHRIRWGVLGTRDSVAEALGAEALPALRAAGDGSLDAILYPVTTPADGDPAAAAHDATRAALALVQELLADDGLADTPLVVVTRGAAPIGEGMTDLAAASVWGLLRSAQSEAPGRIVLVDLDDDPASGAALPAVLLSGEPQVAVRAGRVHLPRARRVSPSGTASPFRGDGTVLITGGTGSLAAELARHLVTRHGVKHLLLISRRGPQAPRAQNLHHELTTLGATVTITACDAADPHALAQTLHTIPDQHPLTAIIHTAGTINDATIPTLTPDQLHDVLRSKADAAWNLHHQTRHHTLDAFVLYSSIAGIIGGPGQANYAAANTFLDALAHHRHTHGLPATSIAWGLWKQTTGITGHLEEADLRRIARAGLRPIEQEHGLAMFDAALATKHPVVVATPLNISTLRENPGQVPFVLRELVRTPARRTAQNTDSGLASLAKRLAELDEKEQRRLVLDVVVTEVAAVLGFEDARSVSDDQQFPDLGFDSLTSVELRNRLSSAIGRRLPATLVFDRPTPGALAEFLRAELLASGTSARQEVDFAAEIHLPDDVRPAGEVVHVADDPGEILLTGATGFLGAFLLRDLLRSTRATVRCLVRAPDEATARERLRANLEWFRVWDEMDPERISVVVGDLAAPRLGLSEADFDDLAKSVDVVYHAGATVNWLYPYADLRAPNVAGTEEVLRLASRHRTVPVHYVSSTGVFAGAATDGTALSVSDPTGPGEALPTGYVQSKWVAEQVIGLARERGLPVSVFRVDVICGDRINGACQTRDFVWLSLKGLLQAGAFPQGIGGTLHLVPVDYVSSAIVSLATQPDTAGRTFHLYNRNGLSFGDCVEHLRALGYPLREQDWDGWRELVNSDRGNAMIPLLDAFELMAADGGNFYPDIDTTETDRALRGTGIDCPPIDRDLFTTYVNFFREVGYFPATPTTADEKLRRPVEELMTS
ncbi:type I polyketide synthase [Nonomuraea polychroma]|uniref:type I polyketide synthase n=1 Tax=Nonomuraea polychroma TaxID=46176 RepID=UPI003D92ABD2